MKRKTVTAFLLLLLATVLVVGVPLGLGVRFPDAAATQWQYTDAEQYVLTEQQMARIFYARTATFFLGNAAPRQVSRETVCRLIEKVVQAADDRQALEQVIRNGVEEHGSTYEEIVAVDGRPVAVRYIRLAYANESGTVTMTFEEKTGTVLMLSCSGAVAEETSEAVKTAVHYYAGTLGLNVEQYSIDTKPIDGVQRWEVSITHVESEVVAFRSDDETDTE